MNIISVNNEKINNDVVGMHEVDLDLTFTDLSIKPDGQELTLVATGCIDIGVVDDLLVYDSYLTRGDEFTVYDSDEIKIPFTGYTDEFVADLILKHCLK